MKKITGLLGLIILVSCSQGDPIAKKKQQLIRYKEQAVQLNLKVKQLEDELAADTTKNDFSKVPVRVLSVEPRQFNHYIEVSGSVKPENEAYISAEISGIIEKIHVQEGDHVKKGTLLFKLNSSVTESSISETKTQLKLAKALYEKQKSLWNDGIGSEVQYLQTKTNYEAARERLKTLQAQLAMFEIRAPFEGIVDQILVKEGELATPGRQLALLINLKKMKIYARVSEQYLNRIKEGDPVEVVFPDMENKTLRLNVFRTGNMIEEKSRDFRIEIKLPNENEEIKPNQFALVRLNDFSSGQALIVPSAVIKQDLKGYFLYTVDKQGNDFVAVKTYIEPGVFYNNMTMILDGIHPGDQVIVDGYNQVSSGQIVNVTE